MVGEIRDRETAMLAIQAALTGHLVLSTLHTNDAPGAIARLIDIGVEPYLIAPALLGVVGQRLVRLVCPSCRKPHAHAGVEKVFADVPLETKAVTLMTGAGCAGCRQTGYSGRIGIFELLTTNDALRDLIVNRASAQQIAASAIRAGFVPLRQAGLAKAAAGVTSLEEVYRVTQDVDGE